MLRQAKQGHCHEGNAGHCMAMWGGRRCGSVSVAFPDGIMLPEPILWTVYAQIQHCTYDILLAVFDISILRIDPQ